MAKLRNYVSQLANIEYIDFKKDGANLAYVYYVLARNKKPEARDDHLRDVLDRKLAQIPTATARAQIGAAFAMLGDGARAGRAFESAKAMLSGKPKLDLSRADFGSDLRDIAAVMALASENGALAKVTNAVMHLAEARGLTADGTTNEMPGCCWPLTGSLLRWKTISSMFLRCKQRSNV